MTRHPSLIVAEIPVEITLAGSSGVGPIPIGTDLSLIERELGRVFSGITPFPARFTAIRSFPNTAIYYLEPSDRAPFDHIHQRVRASSIPFAATPWPYNPHCTLRAGGPLSADAASELLALSFPETEFRINTISVYDLNPASRACQLLYQKKLGP